MNPLKYVSAPVPDDCTLKISPSSFGSFITTPWNWYRQQILGLDKFEYNTMSVTGTIVHYCAEMVAKDQEVNEDYIEEYISSHEENENYCQQTVRDNWYEMAAVLINSYVILEKCNYLATEKEVFSEVSKGIYAAGTLDAIQGSKSDCMLVDYKTYSSKTKPKTIPYNYKYQLMVYAWILRKLGYEVTRVRLVYVNRRIDGGLSEKTGKPLKSYPPEVTVLTEVITEEDFDFIESMLELCGDSIKVAEEHTELTHLIFHDPRLKNK